MASFRFAGKHPSCLVAGETHWPFCTEFVLNGQSWGERVPSGHVLFLYTQTCIHTYTRADQTHKCLGLNVSLTETPAKAADGTHKKIYAEVV